MKPKLLLSILLFGNLTFSNAQEKKYESKSRPTDFEYLSAPDSLGLRHQLKTPNIVTNKKNFSDSGYYKIALSNNFYSWSKLKKLNMG